MVFLRRARARVYVVARFRDPLVVPRHDLVVDVLAALSNDLRLVEDVKAEITRGSDDDQPSAEGSKLLDAADFHLTSLPRPRAFASAFPRSA
jgi:hypothetical protein